MSQESDEQRKMRNTVPGQMAERIREAAQAIFAATDAAGIQAGLKLLEGVRGELEYDAFVEAVVVPGATEIADSIIADARASAIPVVWVTGNHYLPPARSFTAFEHVYQHPLNDNSEADEFRAGMASEHMWEEVERLLNKANVTTFVPDHDNAICAVDLARWEFDDSEHNEDYSEDDINGDWHPKDREPAPDDRDYTQRLEDAERSGGGTVNFTPKK